ncbi:MAG: membrane protein insertase YidC [Mycoplasmataceae bacterium]|nr:membrane protein insertase YidC [Mycoplasmataceae bacterium]
MKKEKSKKNLVNNKVKEDSSLLSFSNNSNLNRSKKFDDLLGNNNRPNTFNEISLKDKFKKIFKWISILIYLFLAAIGITGFIQSCVLHTSSTVGAGIELYNSKSSIAPYVSTFSIETKTRESNQYDENGGYKYDENGNIVKTKENYFVLAKKTKDSFLTKKDTINLLQNQLEQQYGNQVKDLYGVYDNYSSSLRILGTENQTLTYGQTQLSGDVEENQLLKGDKTNNYIFMNNKILDYLNKNGLSYVAQNNWYDLNFFVLERPQNWDGLSNTQKDYYGTGITDLTNAFQAFENINNQWIKVKVLNGKYVTQDVNADGFIDSANYVEIIDQDRINKFRYSLNAEVATLSSSEVGLLNSEKFARDYSQSLINAVSSFSQLKPFYELINQKTNSSIDTNSSVADKFNALSRENLENLTTKKVISKSVVTEVTEDKLFTLEQKDAIISYQNEIFSLLNQLGYGIEKQVYSDQNSPNYTPDNSQNFEVVFLPETKNKKDIVLGTGSAAQKPIYSWAGAWKLGPFYGLIIWPLSYMINGMMSSMPAMNGWEGIFAMVIVIIFTRILVTMFTYKSLFASHKQQQLNPKKAKIDAKYEGFKGNREMEQRKRQELSKLYKDNNVSLIEPLKALCISTPIFLAVWRIVQGIPDIKSTTWLGIQFSLTSWQELFSGSWQYLPLLLAAGLTQALSHFLPRILNKKRMDERANRAERAALKKANKTQNIIMIVFIVLAVIFEAGVQIYWIISGLWQIMQILIVHHIVKTNWYRTKGYKYL